MRGFVREQGILVCDGVPLTVVAGAVGTPTHVYSASEIDDRFGAMTRALAGVPHRVHYAIKANSTLGIVRRLRELGASADVNSGGELELALRAGFRPEDIVLTGVGKTVAELQRAIALGVAAINAESPGEVDRIDALARAAGVTANVAVRINPDVDAGSHRHIATGHRATKFGMSVDEAIAMLADVDARPNLRVVGLHLHIGSQITSLGPFEQAADVLVSLAASLAARGIRLAHLDLGGGLGIAYEPGQPLVRVEDYAATVRRAAQDSGLPVLVEPGRWIVGPAGVLLASVVDVKPAPGGGRFLVADAGMTDLLRPALYEAWHGIEAVAPRAGESIPADVVGPVCETADTLGRERRLPPMEVGDLLVIRDTGAYGAVMASNYNRRTMAAEVLCEAGRWRLVRRRQTIDELLLWDV